MNTACMDFVIASLKGEDINKMRILEVGSFDHNGTVRPAFSQHQPLEYIGIDIAAGPGVDEVCSVYDLGQRFGKNYFDLVINTELLEHVADWKAAINQMKAVTKEGGLMIMTTRTEGFLYHGYPYDFWRYSYDDMKNIFADCDIISLQKDPIEPGIFIKSRKTDKQLCNLEPIQLFCILTGKRKQHLSEEEIKRIHALPEHEIELLWYSPSRRLYRKYIRMPWRVIEKAVVELVKGR